MSQKKILIVEDEAVTAMELEETLKRRGFEVVGTATNGNDALRIAKERWPDLILMDIRIQGPMDGIETADQINIFYDIPVIFLTAYSDDLTISRAIKTKSYSFLLKPFNEKALFSNIEMAINKHRTFAKSLAVQRIVTSMFDLVSDYIVSTDREGNIRRVNATLERATGLNRDDVTGKPFWDTIPIQCTNREQLAGLIRHAQETGETSVHWPYPLILQQSDGMPLSVSLTCELMMCAKTGLFEIMYIFTPEKD
ncbi:MAG: response regulator [Methanoregula sp.]|jgi:PAS domain S-box-containing protein